MGRARKTSYPDYRGAKQFTVKHPEHGQTTVTAPDEDAAIVAAAQFWNTQWTKVDFYAFCEVSREEPQTHPMF